MKKKFNPIIPAEDDGFLIPEVGIWSMEKYQLLGAYCDIFTSGMKKLWKNLIYVDLFAGAGYAKIRENGLIIKSSSLIAMSVPTKFDKYIFCEEDEKLYEALLKRVSRDNVEVFTHHLKGDCNQKIEEIKKIIPTYSKENTVLTFCFIDPFSLNFNFATVKTLADYLVDFLILQALHMDANRNFKHYLKENNERINKYLGRVNWREDWEKVKLLQGGFVRFLADEYDANMKKLGYLTAIRHPIRLPDKNVPLYYLTFYSKHERGLDFFKKVDDYSTNQLKLGI